METLAQRIFGTISEHGRGWVFSPEEFRDFGDPRVIGVALGRMVSAGKIRRLTRGLYDYPKAGEHGPFPPAPDAVARALVGRHNIRLVPAGAYAANLLGLSHQSSGAVVFLTDGPSRTVHVGGQEIRLKQTTPRNVGPAGRTSGLVIQALRHLGQRHVDDLVRGYPRPYPRGHLTIEEMREEVMGLDYFFYYQAMGTRLPVVCWESEDGLR